MHVPNTGAQPRPRPQSNSAAHSDSDTQTHTTMWKVLAVRKAAKRRANNNNKDGEAPGTSGAY